MTQIGVIMNEQNEIASLTDGSKIVLFETNSVNKNWEKNHEINFVETGFYPIDNMKTMRDFLTELVVRLQECKILVGTIITGVPYMILDQKGIMLCEAESLSTELFSAIETDYQIKLQKELQPEIKVEKKAYPKAPYPTLDCGVYELDLRKLQEAHPEVSSKMALIPFLKSVRYEKLYVFCNHIMPWLDAEAMNLDIRYHGEKWKEEGYRIEIQHR